MKGNLLNKLISFSIIFSFSCSSEISVLLKHASEAYNNGNYLTSLFFTDQILHQNPEDEDALLIAVKAHLKLKEYGEASNKIVQLIQISDNPELLFLNSQIYIGLEDFETAILNIEQYLLQDKNLNKSDAIFNLAYCYYEIGNYEKSLHNYLKYILENPLSIDAYLNAAYIFGYLGKSDSAITYYSKVLELDSVNYNALYNRSIENQFKKKYNSAVKDLELLKQYYPDDFNVIIDLAKIRIKEKKYFGAVNELTRAIEIDSTSAEAYFLRGNMFLELARTFSACQDFIKAASLGYFEAYEMINKYCRSKDRK